MTPSVVERAYSGPENPLAKKVFDSQPKERRKFFPALTGLRGLTILWVVFYHLGGMALIFPLMAPVYHLTESIRFRMDVLFVLSGFMMAYVFINRKSTFTFVAYRNFLWRRFTAIYPGHVLTLLPLVAAAVLGPYLHLPLNPNAYVVSALPFQLTLTHSWPGLYRHLANTWNSPSWFLSALWLGYLIIFPFACYLCKRLREPRWTVCWIFGPIVLWLALARRPDAYGAFWFVRTLCGLVCGTALYIAWANGGCFVRIAQKHLDKIVATYVCLLALNLWEPHLASIGFLIGLPFIILGLTGEGTLTVGVLGSRPFVLLGQFSYALFITHGVWIRFFKLVMPLQSFVDSPLYTRISVALIYVVCMAASAWALHKWVELPCKTILKEPPWTKAESADRSKPPTAPQINGAETRSTERVQFAK